MITVDTELALLERAQLVRRLLEDDPAYMFKHALTQESACESLLVKKRREIHRQVAQAHERLYPDRLDEFATVLAGHYAEAGDDAKTVEYATRAGNIAARVYAQTEAITHYTLAIQAAQRAERDMAQLADLYLRRGRALELAGRHGEAVANYQELETAARAQGDPIRELDARLRRATVYAMSSTDTDLAEAYSLSSEALQRAREIGSREVEARALWNLMLANRTSRGDLYEAIEYGEQSIVIARELNLREQLALALQDLGLTYVGIRQNERALEKLKEVEPLWKAMDNKPLLASGITVVASIYWIQGELDQALGAAQEAYAIDYPIGNQYGLTLSTAILAATYSEYGKLDQFLWYIAESERSGQEGGAGGELAGVRTEAARVCMEAGDWARAHALAQRALDIYDKAMPSQRGRTLAIVAQLHLA